jgi:hypothetical protein
MIRNDKKREFAFGIEGLFPGAHQKTDQKSDATVVFGHACPRLGSPRLAPDDSYTSRGSW